MVVSSAISGSAELIV